MAGWYGDSTASGSCDSSTGCCEPQLWDAVDHIPGPVLLVRGEPSPALSESTAGEMVRRFMDARLVVIPGRGHDLGVEQPAAVAEAVAFYLQET